MGSTATLVEIFGDHVGREHRLTLPLTVLGRSQRSDIQLGQESVSRLHAEVLAREGQFIVRDKHSMNGTFVNEAPIDQRVLAEGDEVKVGRTVMRFVLRPASDDGLPPAPDSAGGGAPPAASAAIRPTR